MPRWQAVGVRKKYIQRGSDSGRLFSLLRFNVVILISMPAENYINEALLNNTLSSIEEACLF